MFSANFDDLINLFKKLFILFYHLHNNFYIFGIAQKNVKL